MNHLITITSENSTSSSNIQIIELGNAAELTLGMDGYQSEGMIRQRMSLGF